jgi:hypothetical protein
VTCRCAPALLHLRDQVDARWPHRDKASDGCCGDAAHAARHSDHNPVGGYAHAYDIDENIAPGLGDAPLMFLLPLLLGDPRAKYAIYERRIYYARCTAHGTRCYQSGGHPYSGPNAHEHHLHLSIHDGATHDVHDWRIDTAAPAPPAPTVAPHRRFRMLLVQVEGQPAVWLFFGKGDFVSIEDPADRDTIKAAGVPMIPVKQATFDAMSKR